MYAVVQIGSTQYKVKQGDVIEANRLTAEDGKDISLDQVLLFADGSDVRVGKPYLPDVKVTAKVVGPTLGEKVVAFKFRRRKGISWKKGHRQKLTALTITQISAK